MAAKKQSKQTAETHRLGEKHGRRNLWNEDPSDLVIEEEDPKHPDHEEHKWRVSDENPEWVEFKASAQGDGWWDENVVHVFQRTKGGPIIVANGKRSTTLARLLNKTRKPENRIRVACLPTSNPERTKRMANSNRARERPMTIARWYVDAKTVDGPRKACARLGLTMAEGAAYEKLLLLDAATQAKVNAREIPIDVAVRDLAALPAGEAAAVVEEATGEDGHVQRGKVRAAAKEARERVAPPRLKALPPAFRKAVVENLALAAQEDAEGSRVAMYSALDLQAFTRYLGGEEAAVFEPGVSEEIRDLVTRARKGTEKAAS